MTRPPRPGIPTACRRANEATRLLGEKPLDFALRNGYPARHRLIGQGACHDATVRQHLLLPNPCSSLRSRVRLRSDGKRVWHREPRRPPHLDSPQAHRRTRPDIWPISASSCT